MAAAHAQPPRGKICVTGGSSFIGSHVIKQLLEAGYHVVGTVRSLDKTERYKHLLSLPGADTHLSITGADLLHGPEAFAAAVQGCSAIIHCASPFFFHSDNPAEDLIRPAVEGTLSVLRAAILTGSVKRVVVTSSVAAAYVTRLPPDHVYTERDWSDLGYIRETKQHYAESKLLAERAAWEWMAGEEGKGCGFTLATILPTQTLGPILQPYLNQSSASLLELMDGSKAAIPAKAKCFVDVREVAEAHVKAAELGLPGGAGPRPDPATGQERYLLIAGSWPWRAVAEVLRASVPHARVPTSVDAGPPSYPQALSSTKRVWDLGVRYRPIEDTLKDAAVSLEERGFLAAAIRHTLIE